MSIKFGIHYKLMERRGGPYEAFYEEGQSIGYDRSTLYLRHLVTNLWYIKYPFENSFHKIYPGFLYNELEKSHNLIKREEKLKKILNG